MKQFNPGNNVRRNHKAWLVYGYLLIVILAGALRFYRLNELPPGLWFDEAWSSVAARNSAAVGAYPVYYAASFGGMHPAIVYLARLANWLTGTHPLALRYTLAVVGTLTTAVSFFAYHTIWKLDVKARNVETNHTIAIFALFAALILAITSPFVHFSRMGFESSLPALASLLVFGCLALALEQKQADWFAVTGGVLGLSLYSFDTARLIPIALSVAYWGIVLVQRRPAWRQYLVWYLLLAGTAVLTFLPLGLYFLRHWDIFTERAGVTTYNTLGPGADSVPLAILRNLGRTLGGLSLPGFGDAIARHNLPGRPVFDPFLSLLFWLGVVTMIRRWKRPSSILLAAWAGVMLLAVVLTDGAPTYTRIFGAVPALAAIAALGAKTIIYGCRTCPELAEGLTIGDSRFTAYGLRFTVFLLLLLSLATTVNNYFGRWAREPQLYNDFHVAEWQAGNLALDQLAEGTVYLVPNQVDEAHPTLDLLLHDTAVRSFPAGCLVYQTWTEPPLSYLIHDPSAPDTLAALQAVYPTGKLAEAIINPLTGTTDYKLWAVPVNAAAATPSLTPTAQFGDAIQLLGTPVISVTETATLSGVEVAVILPLTWQATAAPGADHTLFLHLYPVGAEDKAPVAQLDVQPCLPTGQWQPGEIILERYTLSLPPGLPAGDYTIGLGLYTSPSFERLPLLYSNRPLAENRHQPGSVTLWEQ